MVPRRTTDDGHEPEKCKTKRDVERRRKEKKRRKEENDQRKDEGKRMGKGKDKKKEEESVGRRKLRCEAVHSLTST